AGDLVRMAEQFTKWSYEIRRAEEAPVALRRALQVALTPPAGPVFLSLLMDLMRPAVEDTVAGPTVIAGRTRADRGAAAREAGSRFSGLLRTAGGRHPERLSPIRPDDNH